jgi:hypothetical protein
MSQTDWGITLGGLNGSEAKAGRAMSSVNTAAITQVSQRTRCCRAAGVIIAISIVAARRMDKPGDWGTRGLENS